VSQPDRPVVVIVDDDAGTVMLLQLMLDDCRTIPVTSRFADLIHSQMWHGVDVAIVDLKLGQGISGEEILSFLGTYHPQIRRVALSAITDRLPSDEPLAHALLAKPFSLEALRAALART